MNEIFKLLLKIKKSKLDQLKELSKKIEIISNRDNSRLFEDLKELLNCCDYHFYGGFTESMGEICPCNCYCKNCEMIPESEIPIMMQEIATNMTEKNVFDEFVDKYAIKENNGST